MVVIHIPIYNCLLPNQLSYWNAPCPLDNGPYLLASRYRLCQWAYLQPVVDKQQQLLMLQELAVLRTSRINHATSYCWNGSFYSTVAINYPFSVSFPGWIPEVSLQGGAEGTRGTPSIDWCFLILHRIEQTMGWLKGTTMKKTYSLVEAHRLISWWLVIINDGS